jgi:hypothetical protein
MLVPVLQLISPVCKTGTSLKTFCFADLPIRYLLSNLPSYQSAIAILPNCHPHFAILAANLPFPFIYGSTTAILSSCSLLGKIDYPQYILL